MLLSGDLPVRAFFVSFSEMASVDFRLGSTAFGSLGGRGGLDGRRGRAGPSFRSGKGPRGHYCKRVSNIPRS
jgi:hypothetical protein